MYFKKISKSHIRICTDIQSSRYCLNKCVIRCILFVTSFSLSRIAELPCFHRQYHFPSNKLYYPYVGRQYAQYLNNIIPPWLSLLTSIHWSVPHSQLDNWVCGWWWWMLRCKVFIIIVFVVGCINKMQVKTYWLLVNTKTTTETDTMYVLRL